MNKIDRYVFGAALALCSASAVQAQGLENIIVEDYYTISQADADAYNGGFGGGGFPLVAGMKCYRIYVDMAPGYKLNQVFGSPTPQGGGASPNPLDITTTTTFWNDDNWGSEFPSQTRRLPQGAAFDSYITVNTTGTGSTGTTCGSTAAQFGVLRSADTNGNLTMCTVYPGFSGNDGNVPGTGPALTTNLSGSLDFSALRADGSSFVVVDDSWTTLPTSQGVDPTGTNRVLIGQFTTDGALSFKLNVQLSSPTSQLETYVHTTAGAGETVSPLLTYPQSLPPDCLGVPGGTAQPGTACDDGNAATGNDTWNANCVCVGQTIDCAGVPGGTALPGTACDDGNASTGNDTWNASCVCVGQTIDCAGVPGGTALPGTACDDGNASTGNDVYGANCVCAGQTIDCLGVPGGTALPGTACDDGNASTGNDVYGANCVCAGQTIDCLGVPGGTALPGTACDDGNASTGNDVYGANCVCAGQLIDCLGVPGGTALIGSPCDDGNASTTNDAYNPDCVCEGSTVDCNDNDPCTADSFNGTACVHTPLPDTDSDGTCDLIDGCPTDPNKIAPGICGCGVPDVDTDSDGVADCQDSCPNLAGQVGSTCDDGNAQTVNDTINANCVCVGTPLAGDCLGVPGGTALPGTACDDDDATTENDTWNANCVCVGTSIFDCPALQADFGDACDDGDATTENDVVGTDCVCAGTSIYDCPVLQANIGDACDDGNASTINDVVTASCVCAGTPTCTENLTLAIKLDAFGSQTTWNLKDANTNVVVDQ
ncbi:MAG: hypothetical protein JST66_11160, partial [Bacteroidetes bacterium]|nr:hypothetical protein [Bacteroidota bacterium]